MLCIEVTNYKLLLFSFSNTHNLAYCYYTIRTYYFSDYYYYYYYYYYYFGFGIKNGS